MPSSATCRRRRCADRWWRDDLGYCSVGCGMFIGVRDGRAVSVRGNPDHPVNRGMLCPKGLSEHHTIDAENRARVPLMKQRSIRPRGRWRTRSRRDGRSVPRRAGRYGRDAVGVISTGQLVTEEFYALGKLVQLGIGTRNYDGNTTLCMSTAVAGYKRSFGSDGRQGLRGFRTRRRHPADRREHRRQPPDPLAAGSKPIPAPRSSSSTRASPRRRCWPTCICRSGRAPTSRC